MTNFISNDVNRFDRYMLFLPFLFVAPLQLLISTAALYYYIGISSLAGVGFLLLMIPAQGLMGWGFGRLRRIVARKTDFRVQIIKEVVNGILLVKMFCWEKPFTQRVTDARK